MLFPFAFLLNLVILFRFQNTLWIINATTAPMAANTTRQMAVLSSSRLRCTSSRSNALPFCLRLITLTVVPFLFDLVHSKYPSYSNCFSITSSFTSSKLNFSGTLCNTNLFATMHVPLFFLHKSKMVFITDTSFLLNISS